jgi:hypothetical protein
VQHDRRLLDAKDDDGNRNAGQLAGMRIKAWNITASLRSPAFLRHFMPITPMRST